MSVHFNIEPEELQCMKIKVPVVLAEEEVQVLVDTTVTLPELAKKVDHIDGRVEGLEAEPVFIRESFSAWYPKIKKEWQNHFNGLGIVGVLKKVIVSGVLHKQIYYVNQQDQVKHFAEDVPFTKMIELKKPQPVLDEDDVTVQFKKPKLDISWELVRASRLHQTAVIIIRIKVVEERQLYVQLCVPEIPCPGNLLEDPGLEKWVEQWEPWWNRLGHVPVFWHATANVDSTGKAHSGSLAAELGVPEVTKTASIFQIVRRCIIPGKRYKLTFWAREDVKGVTSNFDLIAEVRFFDINGIQIDGASKTWPSTSIPDGSYDQFALDVPAAPAGARMALILLTFSPKKDNTNTVKIDDVSFEIKG